MSKTLYLRVAALVLVCGACAHDSLQQALDKSNSKQKPLIVEFYAPWCAPCVSFENKVLQDDEVRSALEKFEYSKYNIDTNIGNHHRKRLGLQMVPAVVALDENGEIIATIQGATSKENFLKFLEQHQTRL